jgi:hypothetical protein
MSAVALFVSVAGVGADAGGSGARALERLADLGANRKLFATKTLVTQDFNRMLGTYRS